MDQAEIARIAQRVTRLWIARQPPGRARTADDAGAAEMAARLRGEARRVRRHYEDPARQERALARVPVDRLHAEAHADAGANADAPMAFEDRLLRRLCRWFKHEFFRWVDRPPCSRCQAGVK